MKCFRPLEAFKGPVGEEGKVEILWKHGPDRVRQDLPCGQCIGCRLKYSKFWAFRCMAEASCWEDNSFLTLTYDQEHLPADRSLHPEDVAGFIKRLRQSRVDKLKRLHAENWRAFFSPIRYYGCGEYGDDKSRPHYHVLLFNCDFEDKVHWSTRNGNKIWLSESLRKLWPFGNHYIGSVTFESAAYVARYVTKKVNGELREKKDKDGLGYYDRVCGETGEVFHLRPESPFMSRRPGIGETWIRKYWSDVYPSDEVIVKGHALRPPRYFDKWLEKFDPFLLDELKEKRSLQVRKTSAERLGVEEKVQLSRLNTLRRPMEESW